MPRFPTICRAMFTKRDWSLSLLLLIQGLTWRVLLQVEKLFGALFQHINQSPRALV